MKPVVVLELDLNASALLDLLVELGHLDETMLAAVNDRFLDLPMAGGCDLAPFMRDWSQSEKLSEIKPPLELL